jgi:hypothetical protein
MGRNEALAEKSVVDALSVVALDCDTYKKP